MALEKGWEDDLAKVPMFWYGLAEKSFFTRAQHFL